MLYTFEGEWGDFVSVIKLFKQWHNVIRFSIVLLKKIHQVVFGTTTQGIKAHNRNCHQYPITRTVKDFNNFSIVHAEAFDSVTMICPM